MRRLAPLMLYNVPVDQEARWVSERTFSAFFGLFWDLCYADDFERNKNMLYPSYLPIKHGLVLDLKSGDTFQRTQEMLYTFECPVMYEAKLKYSPTFTAHKFFSQITMDSKDRYAYFKTQLGYCMTGKVSLRKWSFPPYQIRR